MFARVRKGKDDLISLYYWLKIFTEGKGLRAKLLLLPCSTLLVISYGMNSIPVIRDYLYALVIKRLAPAVTIKNKNGLFVCRKNTTDFLMVNEAFERKLTKYLKEVKDGVFIDIGANVGRYTIKMAKQIGNRGKVIAIEADPENYRIMLENIKLNKLENVYAFNVACWDKEEDIKFAAGSIGAIVKNGISSIKSESSNKMITVHGNTLDNILMGLGIEKVDIVKIDVEGAEKEVLLGMRNTIAGSSNIELLFEAWRNSTNLEECRKVLQDYGLVVENKEIDREMYRARKMA